MPTAGYRYLPVLLSLLASPLAASQPMRLQLEVDANGVSRHNAPVSATLDASVPAEFGDRVRATLTPADGGTDGRIPAQVERYGNSLIVHWIEPFLEPGAVKNYTLKIDPSIGSQTGQAAFRFVDGDGYRDLLLGDRPIYRHMNKYDPADRENTYKPFYQVYGMHYDGFITKGAGGKFPHHRGLFFGFKTPHGDFWHCPGGVSLRHRKYDTAHEMVGPIVSRGVAITDWVGKDAKAILRDTQQVTAWNLGQGRLILDFDITVESLAGQPIPLGGDPHHAGFHFRAAQEVADVPSADKQGGGTAYTRPPAAKHVGNDVWENCAWLDGVFSIRGNRYGVTHMNAPTNPRPTAYSARGYGRFGAYFAAEVHPDKPLKLRYRIAIRDANEGGATTSLEELGSAYENFVAPVRASLAR